MVIYLACTVRGDRGAVMALRELATALEAAGHTVLTKHLLDDAVDAAEAALTERAVYERDMSWLETCNLLIADASGSSFGVGFEVGYVLGRADRSGQRVVMIYDESRQHAISRLVVGNAHPACMVLPYKTAAGLVSSVSALLVPS